MAIVSHAQKHNGMMNAVWTGKGSLQVAHLPGRLLGHSQRTCHLSTSNAHLMPAQLPLAFLLLRLEGPLASLETWLARMCLATLPVRIAVKACEDAQWRFQANSHNWPPLGLLMDPACGSPPS